MGFIIIFVCVIAGLILLGSWFSKQGGYKAEDHASTCMIVAIVVSAVFVIVLLTLPFAPSDNRKIVYEHEALVNLVESIPDQRSPFDCVDDYHITDKVLSMNENIATHKARCNSFFFGIWYSKDVANLKPITFKSRTSGGE